MGLGSKIKQALHGDDHAPATSQAATSHGKAPGAYPSEEYLGKSGHNDGLVGNTARHTNAAGHPSGDHTLDQSASQRGKLHKGAVDGHDPLRDELSPKSATSQQSWDSGVGGVGKTNAPKDRGSSGGYWGEMGHGNKPMTAANDLPDRSHYQSGNGPTEDRHQASHAPGQLAGGGVHNGGPTADRHQASHAPGQLAGGGVHNGVTGTGSHNYQDGRSNHEAQHGAVHDPLTSGTRGIPVGSNDGYGSNYVQDNPMSSHHNVQSNSGLNDQGLEGQGLNSRGLNSQGLNAQGLNSTGLHNTQSHGGGHNSHGLGGSGLNSRGGIASHVPTGAGAAHHGVQRGVDERDNYTYGDTPRDAGVPKTSMLDPEPASQPQTHATPRAGGFASPSSNEAPVQRSAGGAGPNVTSATENQGKSHHGPGHEEAKVLHQCEHCGKDNDISRYFKNDVVYRLGS